MLLTENEIESLKKSIRDIPDFPKKGIVFKDVSTLLKDPGSFKKAIDAIAAHYTGLKFDLVVGVEARGFIFGAAFAYRIGAGFVLLRKKGKLPAETVEVTYALEYGHDTLAIHKDAFSNGKRALIVDDLLATGGTLVGACELVEKCGGNVAGICTLVELTFLHGRQKLTGHDLFSLLQF